MKKHKGDSQYSWAEYVQELQGLLRSVEFSQEGERVSADEGFLAWANLTQTHMPLTVQRLRIDTYPIAWYTM